MMIGEAQVIGIKPTRKVCFSKLLTFIGVSSIGCLVGLFWFEQATVIIAAPAARLDKKALLPIGDEALVFEKNLLD